MTSGKPLLLLVDDDPVLRMITHQTLIKQGFEVGEAENGKQAIQLIQRVHADLILLDVVMPEMDGYTFCSWLRAQPFGARTPVMMMTGLDDESSIQKAFDVGATDFITKPVNYAILAQRVRFLLRASQAMQDLALSRENLAEAQRIARLGSWEMDLASKRMQWSEEVYRIFQADQNGFANTFDELLDFVHPEDRQKVEQLFWETQRVGKPQDCVNRVLLRNGQIKWMSVRCEPQPNTVGLVASVRGTLQDITERRQNEETIRYLSSYDSLTGLPNRLMFGDRLERALAQVQHNRGMLAVLHVGLDRFKRINESFGHMAGDAVLIEVAERLRASLRTCNCAGLGQSDPQMEQDIARWNGDEFIILLSELRVPEDAARAARRLLDNLAKTMTISDQEISLGATTGIALYPGDGENAMELLKNADSALHYSKDNAPGGYGFYTRAINERTLLKLSLESALRKALDRNELIAFYQPKVDAVGHPVGAELLLRWQHPELGLLTPDKFIDLAEECNLIVPIGEWVIDVAVRQLRLWRTNGNPELSLAINLSPTHFHHPDLLRVLDAARTEHSLQAGCLEIELTEGMLMKEVEETQRLLLALKDLGMRLAIDDFGTGYSSLSYLSRFPIDVLKIDRGFIRGIPEEHNQKNITRAIIALAHSLNLQVVAEGVETDAQAAFLKQEGCDVMQGFLYSRPLPIAQFTTWLRSKK